jgi:predicted DCC family thiol-disulfide oxidoreductase YuxK
MREFVGTLDRFWFAAMPARRLAVLRLLVGGYSLYYLGSSYFQLPIRASGPPGTYEPVGLAWLLPGPLPPWVFQGVLLATLVTNVAFVVGWRFRVAGPLFGVLLAYLLCYRNSWGMIYHSDNLLVLHALVLGLSRAADALSVDALVQHARQVGRARLFDVPRALTSWEYGWPIRLVCAVTCLTYFLAGIAKVTGPAGWEWVTAESLRSQIAVDGLRKQMLAGSAPDLAFAFAAWDEFFLGIGVLTLVVELGAPAAVWHRWVAAIWVPAALMMHWGILFIMGIEFTYALLGLPFVAFFPLERLLSPVDSRVVVLYDGRCARCLASRRWLAWMDRTGRAMWVSFRDPDVRAVVPRLRDDQLEREMWVVASEGQMFPGFAGWRHLLATLPVTRLPSLLLYLPPIAGAGERMYRRTARHRRLCAVAPQVPTPPGPWIAILARASQSAERPGLPLPDDALSSPAASIR